MQREVILIVGKTGCGKTTWARNFIRDKNRVLVLEANFGEFGIMDTPTFAELTEKSTQNFFRLSYSPRWWEWPYVLETSRLAGNLWLVLEEADRLEPPRDMPEYDEIINRGRHFGINLVAISTRPAKLPPDYRAQVTRLVAFQTHEPRDLDYLGEIMGDDVYRLPELKPFQCFEWTAVRAHDRVGG